MGTGYGGRRTEGFGMKSGVCVRIPSGLESTPYYGVACDVVISNGR